MAKERVAYIDMAAGIMILWMMLGHVGASRLDYPTQDFIVLIRRVFFFFMPWFFYKSGMFFSVNEHTNRGGGKLLVPFVIWSLIGYVVYAVAQIFWGVEPLYKLLLVRPLKAAIFQNLILCNEPLWFLLTLFCVINIANIALKKIHPLVISILGIIIGYGIFLTHNEYIPDVIANTATGLCFFCIGYWMQERQHNKWIVVGAFVGYILSIVLFHSPFVDMRKNICLTNGDIYYLLYFPASLCGIIVLNVVCEIAHRLYSFPILRFIGKNAMAFYVTHYIVLYVIGYVLVHIVHIMDKVNLWYCTLLLGIVFVPIVVYVTKIIEIKLKSSVLLCARKSI